MCKELFYLLAVITIFLMPAPLWAGGDDSFLTNLQDSLIQGKTITVYFKSGEVRKGYFMGFDSSHSALLLASNRYDWKDVAILPVNEITTVRHGDKDIWRIPPFWATGDQIQDKCRLKMLNKIKERTLISVFDKSGAVHRGRISSIDSASGIGKVYLLGTGRITARMIDFHDITRVQYSQRKIRPEFMALGTIGGLIFSGAAGSIR